MVDISQIQTLLGLAGLAATTTGDAASAVTKVKEIFSRKEGGPSQDELTLLNNLASQLTAANMTNVQLSQAIKQLSFDLQRDSDFEALKSRYELVETSTGDMVFKLKESAKTGEPMHYACPVCLNKERLLSFVTGSQYYKSCQTCKTGYRFSEHPNPKRPGSIRF